MVRAFEEHQIRFLVCTSTIIEGVNTAAENVTIYDSPATNIMNKNPNAKASAARWGFLCLKFPKKTLFASEQDRP